MHQGKESTEAGTQQAAPSPTPTIGPFGPSPESAQLTPFLKPLFSWGHHTYLFLVGVCGPPSGPPIQTYPLPGTRGPTRASRHPQHLQHSEVSGEGVAGNRRTLCCF